MNAAQATDRSPARLVAWLTFVLLFVVLQYYGRSLGSPSSDVLYEWATFVGGVVQGVFLLGVATAIAWAGPARELFALRRPRGWGAAARIGVFVFVAILVVASVLDRWLGASEEQGFVPDAWDPDRAAPFAANFVVAAVLFPAVEELLFRGLGYSLLSRYGDRAAIAATAVLFALAHGLVNALPIFVVFGLGLGWLRSRTASVVPCILVHAAFNAFALAGVVVAGERG